MDGIFRSWRQRIAALVIGTAICVIWGVRAWWILAGSVLAGVSLWWLLRSRRPDPIVEYCLSVENCFRAHAIYDHLLGVQAADVELLKAFHMVCRAGFLTRTSAEETAMRAMEGVRSYYADGRESALISFEETAHLMVTGPLLDDYGRFNPADLLKDGWLSIDPAKFRRSK